MEKARAPNAQEPRKQTLRYVSQYDWQSAADKSDSGQREKPARPTEAAYDSQQKHIPTDHDREDDPGEERGPDRHGYNGQLQRGRSNNGPEGDRRGV
ncbi:hypothetical protein FKP32DRAFT_1597172 [Trametes sanguinea]|nr:hypothetical protein FKP32DRAFT_1597172 [Trametes sanguinea]